MTERIRTLHLPLPNGWEAAPVAAVPPLPWMRQAGVTIKAIQNATSAATGSTLALYSAHGTPAALEALANGLRRGVGAIGTPGALSWVVATDQWISLNALLTSAAVQGPPVLCATRFTRATADQHLDEVVGALEQAEWRW